MGRSARHISFPKDIYTLTLPLPSPPHCDFLSMIYYGRLAQDGTEKSEMVLSRRTSSFYCLSQVAIVCWGDFAPGQRSHLLFRATVHGL